MDILERFGKRERGVANWNPFSLLVICFHWSYLHRFWTFSIEDFSWKCGSNDNQIADFWNQSPWLINTCFCVLDNIAWIIQRCTSGIKLQGKNFLCYGNRKMFLSDITWKRENCTSFSHTFLKSTSLKSLMRTFGRLSNIVHMVKPKSFF